MLANMASPVRGATGGIVGVQSQTLLCCDLLSDDELSKDENFDQCPQQPSGFTLQPSFIFVSTIKFNF